MNATEISVNMWKSVTAIQVHFLETLNQKRGFLSLTALNFQVTCYTPIALLITATHSTVISIDLNQLHGADDQYAFNRSSLLCGSCQPDLSLSLCSSRCLQSPNNWPTLLAAITIAAILSGIALVALLLVLNMTVAVGTLNGLIFYANVVYANRSILLLFQETRLVIVFISLLNLELGIDTCYFPGMDTYTKHC